MRTMAFSPLFLVLLAQTCRSTSVEMGIEACEGKVDDEVSLIQLTQNRVDRNKKAAPAENGAGAADVTANILSQDATMNEATMTAVKSALEGALKQEFASTGKTSPVDVNIIMGSDAPAAAVAADPTNLVAQAPNDWKPTPDGLHQPDMNAKLDFESAQMTQAAAQPMGPPGGVPMSTPVGNITIVISPPLSIDPQQPDPSDMATTIVPANMVKGFAEPLTGVPPQAVVGYQPPPPPTGAPPAMGQMMPGMMQPGMMQPGMMPGMMGGAGMPPPGAGVTGIPLAAFGNGAQAQPAMVGVPVDAFQNTPQSLVSTLLGPAADAYAQMR